MVLTVKRVNQFGIFEIVARFGIQVNLWRRAVQYDVGHLAECFAAVSQPFDF